MSVATVAAVAGVGASIAGGVIQGNAAKSAANTQVAAANEIGTQAQQAADKATGDVNAATSTANSGITDSNAGLTAAQNQQLAALAPYTTAGSAALNPLQSAIASETDPSKQFSFTPEQYQQDPQYAFELAQQEQALQRSAAASGGLLTGGTAKATARLANNFTSTNYGTALNEALQTYTTNRQNLLSQISGYQNLVGTGLSATNTENQDIYNTAAEVNANNNKIAANNIAAGTYAGNTGLTAAQIRAQALTGGANAAAAGTIGAANAETGALNGVANGLYRGLAPLTGPKLPKAQPDGDGSGTYTGPNAAPGGVQVNWGGTGGAVTGNSFDDEGLG